MKNLLYHGSQRNKTQSRGALLNQSTKAWLQHVHIGMVNWIVQRIGSRQKEDRNKPVIYILIVRQLCR